MKSPCNTGEEGGKKPLGQELTRRRKSKVDKSMLGISGTCEKACIVWVRKSCVQEARDAGSGEAGQLLNLSSCMM